MLFVWKLWNFGSKFSFFCLTCSSFSTVQRQWRWFSSLFLPSSVLYDRTKKKHSTTNPSPSPSAWSDAPVVWRDCHARVRIEEPRKIWKFKSISYFSSAVTCLFASVSAFLSYSRFWCIAILSVGTLSVEWVNYYFLRPILAIVVGAGWCPCSLSLSGISPHPIWVSDINYNIPLALISIGIDIIMTSTTTVECRLEFWVLPGLLRECRGLVKTQKRTWRKMGRSLEVQ